MSNLRKEFVKLKREVEDKNKLIIGWEQKAVEANSMLKTLQGVAGANGRGDKETTSVGLQVTTKDSDWNATPSVGKTRKYSDVLADRQGTVPYDHKLYKLFVKSKLNQIAEYCRTLLKRKVSPIHMKVGISALKTLKNGQLLIESEKKSELEEVCKKINEVCGEELESYMQTLREPRIIVFNVPEDITTENAVQAIVLQNSELDLYENEIKQKFEFEDKKTQKPGTRSEF